LCLVPSFTVSGLLTGGFIWTGNAYRGILRRYLPWGEPDWNFGPVPGYGYVLVDYAPNTDEFVRAVGLQPNSKIIAAGEALNSDFSGNGRFVVWRFNANGTPDTTFGAGGKATAFFGVGRVWDMAIDSDSRIVVAGSMNSQVAIARFRDDGFLDTTFSGDGLVTASWGHPANLEGAYGLDLDGDKIVIAGRVSNHPTTRMGAMRFTSGGSLDTTFSDDGKTVIDFPGGVNEVGHDVDCLPGQGCFVVGSFQSGSESQFAVARLTSTGGVDPAFGMRTNSFPGFYWAYATRVVANVHSGITDVTILGSAFPSNGGPGQMALARYTSSGILDNTFDIDGRRTVVFPALTDIGWGTALTFDGTAFYAVGEETQ
jgi:uncharacterized delta-60 repeat protein